MSNVYLLCLTLCAPCENGHTMENFLEVIRWQVWGSPVFFIIGGFFVGYIFDKIVLKKLNLWVESTEWNGAELIIRAVQRVGRYWFFLAGCYLALPYLHLE